MLAEKETQRRIQFGVAKKIKNGSRKIVLEKAEEARDVGFSAFKALGVATKKAKMFIPPSTDVDVYVDWRATDVALGSSDVIPCNHLDSS
uniref:Helicase and polymerase-containing protein TEBICHI n=1 Tax=Tanacetum cinerariifolium TaxID=118510 RepID=A0A6L2J317_TANCI|nr:helicase and polymerase-containing protein TEBICHI [Tanacetum cinerariifolium]